MTDQTNENAKYELGVIAHVDSNRQGGQIRAANEGRSIGELLYFDFTNRRRICPVGSNPSDLMWVPFEPTLRSTEIRIGDRVIYVRRGKGCDQTIESWAGLRESLYALTKANGDHYVIKRRRVVVWSGTYNEGTNCVIDQEGDFPSSYTGIDITCDVSDTPWPVQKKPIYNLLRNAMFLPPEGQRKTKPGRRAM